MIHQTVYNNCLQEQPDRPSHGRLLSFCCESKKYGCFQDNPSIERFRDTEHSFFYSALSGQLRYRRLNTKGPAVARLSINFPKIRSLQRKKSAHLIIFFLFFKFINVTVTLMNEKWFLCPMNNYFNNLSYVCPRILVIRAPRGLDSPLK